MRNCRNGEEFRSPCAFFSFALFLTKRISVMLKWAGFHFKFHLAVCVLDLLVWGDLTRYHDHGYTLRTQISDI